MLIGTSFSETSRDLRVAAVKVSSEGVQDGALADSRVTDNGQVDHGRLRGIVKLEPWSHTVVHVHVADNLADFRVTAVVELV